jgi:hypothetical protein
MAYGLLTAVADNDTPDSVIELLISRRSNVLANATKTPAVGRLEPAASNTKKALQPIRFWGFFRGPAIRHAAFCYIDLIDCPSVRHRTDKAHSLIFRRPFVDSPACPPIAISMFSEPRAFTRVRRSFSSVVAICLPICSCCFPPSLVRDGPATSPKGAMGRCQPTLAAHPRLARGHLGVATSRQRLCVDAPRNQRISLARNH